MSRIDRSTLPHFIRSAREALDLTQLQLAEYLGMQEQTVRRYERLGAPRWMELALEGLALRLGHDPEVLREQTQKNG